MGQDPWGSRAWVEGAGWAGVEAGSQYDKDRRIIFSQVTTPGVGLGLHIVNGLMEAQGGRFDIESEGLKQGTRAILEFPAGEGQASAGEVVKRMEESQRS